MLAALFIESVSLVSSIGSFENKFIPIDVVSMVMAATTGTQSARNNNVDERILVYIYEIVRR